MTATLNNERMPEPEPPVLDPVQAPMPSSGSAAPPDYTVWSVSQSHSLSVLPGPCSFLQCPECPRKLPLDSVHHHLVRKTVLKMRAHVFK